MKRPAKIAFVGFCIFVVFVVLTMYLPENRTLIMAANEASALQSVRSIYQAELSYSETLPGHGFSCSFAKLQDSSKVGHKLPTGVASGFKSGYIFVLSDCKTATPDHALRASFKLLAKPMAAGRTGKKSFCVDESGHISIDPQGGANCSQALQ